MTDINPDHTTSKQSLNLTGTCYCKSLSYNLRLDDKMDARTTLCHCANCKKAFGGAFGLTAKVPIQAFRYTTQNGKPTVRIIGCARKRILMSGYRYMLRIMDLEQPCSVNSVINAEVIFANMELVSPIEIPWRTIE